MGNYKISACVVTYNSVNEIRTILNALFSSTIDNQLDVYVVDNASSDGTSLVIEKEFPKVKLIKMRENVGFGAGHNRVISKVESKYHLIVNPDIDFDMKLLNGLSEYMDQNSDVAVVSPKILNHDGTEQYLPKLNPKLKFFIGGKLEPYGEIFARWRSEYTRRDELFTQPIDIEFCTGCFMFARTSALKKVGGFDERYFLHFEDADLTRMLKKDGRVIFNPCYSVYHGWQRDNAKYSKVFFIAFLSMIKYFKKWGLS